jgi:hypothetical protein
MEQHTTSAENMDAVEGPFTVFTGEVCSFCFGDACVAVRNSFGARVFEICNVCGYEKEYDRDAPVN